MNHSMTPPLRYALLMRVSRSLPHQSLDRQHAVRELRHHRNPVGGHRSVAIAYLRERRARDSEGLSEFSRPAMFFSQPCIKRFHALSLATTVRTVNLMHNECLIS